MTRYYSSGNDFPPMLVLALYVGIFSLLPAFWVSQILGNEITEHTVKVAVVIDGFLASFVLIALARRAIKGRFACGISLFYTATATLQGIFFLFEMDTHVVVLIVELTGAAGLLAMFFLSNEATTQPRSTDGNS